MRFIFTSPSAVQVKPRLPRALHRAAPIVSPFLGIALLLGVTAGLRAQDSDCLVCHQDESLSTLRDGREVPLFVDGEQHAASIHGFLACIDCHDGVDPESLPHRATPIAVDCLACHADPGASHAFHPAIAEAQSANERPDVACATCHGTHGITATADPLFAFAADKLTAACGECHAAERDAYLHSAHAIIAEGTSPSCLACHHTDVVDGKRTPQETKLAQTILCLSCHVDQPEVARHTRLAGRFVAVWNDSIHGMALMAGNGDAANCVDCHGSHEMNRAMVADSRVNKLHIAETCHTCHVAAVDDYNRGAHAAALQRGILDSPVCTDCHGEHLILGAHDPRSPVAPRNVSQQLCGDCHGSVRLAQKYGISSDRFATFADSFHGLAVRGGAIEVVNCASCHGYHGILASSDPLSPVHKANLAQTCGQCHPGANERFAVGSVHVAISPVGAKSAGNGEEIIPIIATIYIWAIIVIVGGMLVHNGLDYFKKARRKIRGRDSAGEIVPQPHRLYVRMTVNERLQHGTLALSFILLVITGFMLRFPEAWWVESLRAINDHLFEMRGWLHRAAAVAMVAAGIWHTVYITTTHRGRELIRNLLPRWRDVADMGGVLRYNLGLARQKPQFGRFSYIEKLEYWALLWGSVIMTVTGVLLWADDTTMGLFSKLGFDVARTVHYYEAVLAALSVVVWHFYFVIFNPDVYPMNPAWLTGRLTEAEMAAEHPLELKRLQAVEPAARVEKSVDRKLDGP